MKTSRPCETTRPISRSAPRGGFTLVELMVAVAVLLILAALTLTALSVTAEEDVAEGARSVQSFTEGARDRAIYRKRPVGIRLLLDPNGTISDNGTPADPTDDHPITANSLQYVGSPTETLKGYLMVDNGTNVPGTVTAGGPVQDLGRILISTIPPIQPFEPQWESIRQNRGLISHAIQMPIRIDLDPSPTAETWENYIVAWSDSYNRWVLTRAFSGTLMIPLEYELELLPAVMPHQQIRELPRDAIINLPDSKIPSFWYDSSNSRFISYMDVMFSPRGTGIGSASGSGWIHLHICSPEDRERVKPGGGRLVIGNPQNSSPERILSINPVTGNITVAQVLPFVDADRNDIPDTTPYDPFVLAEAGVTAQ